MRHDLIARTTLQMNWLSDSCHRMARAKERKKKQLEHQVMLWGWAPAAADRAAVNEKTPS